LPLLVIARIRKINPRRRLLYCAAITALISVLMIMATVIGWYVLILDVLLWFIALIDVLTVPPDRKFSATRSLLRIASLAKPQDVEIELTNHSKTWCRIAIKDDLPQSFKATPEQVELGVEGKSRILFRYHFTSSQRGQQVLEFVHLRVTSRLGLWDGFFKLPCKSVVNVYPDMQQISEYDLLAKTNRLSLMGLRRTRKIGQDNEFERLRDYTPDDNYRHIDWRSTARRRKLTVRDFQSNQSQRIIFMVDCGRMMTGMAGDISLLDHSLNAMLMLSYVALRQGDSVGLISFSNSIHNFTPPRPGVKHINRLLHASFNQRPAYVESRYDEAFLYLASHCRKRSLVVLMTNVIDEINSHQIRQYLGSITGRHLPLGVLLRDRDIFSTIDEVDPARNESIYQGAAAVDVLSRRHQVITDLQHQGVLILDVFPEQLTSGLVNQYLEIKARHLL
jgi:uncharacterized protein (DUF58 family)